MTASWNLRRWIWGLAICVAIVASIGPVRALYRSWAIYRFIADVEADGHGRVDVFDVSAPPPDGIERRIGVVQWPLARDLGIGLLPQDVIVAGHGNWNRLPWPALRHVEFLRRQTELEELNLASTDLDDEGLRRLDLQNLPHLRILDLCNTEITDRAFDGADVLGECRELDLSYTQITGILFSAAKFPKLEKLTIGGDPLLSEQGLQAVGQLDTLVSLTLVDSAMLDLPDDYFRGLPRLSKLVLRCSDWERRPLTPGSIDAICRSDSLRSLVATGLTASDAEKIFGMESLEEVFLAGGAPLSDVVVEAIIAAKHLRDLCLRCDVKTETMVRIRTARPDLTLTE